MSGSRAVYITGAPRCGSSWVGQILGGLRGVRYIYEPFNLKWVPSLQGKLTHFEYLDAGSEGVEQQLILTADRAFKGRQSSRQLLRATFRGYAASMLGNVSTVIVKDPTAPLITDWVAQRYDALPLIIIRHPCGFASSIGELGWRLNTLQILRQKKLMKKYLGEYETFLKKAGSDVWATRAAIWCSIHIVLLEQLRRNPNWLLHSYEDICEHPVAKFRTIAAELGLEWTDKFDHKVLLKSVKPDIDSGSTNRVSKLMPDVWQQRLSTSEIDTILEVCDRFGLADYPNCFRLP
jgi:hypothetical protein